MRTMIPKWIRNQVKSAKAKGCIVGISGGIDSAVVAALCLKAMGGKNVLGLILPCHSLKEDINDAVLTAKVIGLQTKTINLTPLYDILLKIFPKGKKMAFANIKPRLRMIALYYFANMLNYLVVGTGNKSELSVGYFTKYGDGGVDIMPIAGLYKNSVRNLAKTLGIPDKIITKKPTAGLWPGQTDEGEMGITYNELDAILDSIYKGKMLKHQKTSKVMRMFKASAHKRALPPIFTYP